MKHLCCCLFIISLCLAIPHLAKAQKIKGITVVAPPSKYKTDPIDPIKEISGDYIKVVPYGFSRPESTKIAYNMDRQWWGEKVVGVVETIRLAKAQGVSVMLKPQIYVPGSWIGDLDYKTESEWMAWEENYRAFIMSYLQIAIDEEVEIFCIGTENKKSIEKRPQFWYSLIEEMRTDYCGLLTYSANWDAFENVPFWQELDYIGISCYFPLSEETTPKVSKLLKAWSPIVKKLRSFSNRNNVPILFTEYGYLSVDGCAGKTWELEKKVKRLNINEQAQANALSALYAAFWEEDFWAGGFLWKWFPEGKGHEGYIERDYTPQDKLALNVLKEWFEKDLE